MPEIMMKHYNEFSRNDIIIEVSLNFDQDLVYINNKINLNMSDNL